MTTIANVEMAAAWNGADGDDWARDWQHYDRAVQGYHEALLAAAAIRAGERVLDVGCGCGQSARAAARACRPGDVLAVDLSSQMLRRADELARAERLGNVRFLQADAQVHPFGPGAFDVVLSRFGAMFFADPEAAFRNIARALRPGGRLVMVAWRELADNEWLGCLFDALRAGRDLPTPRPGTPGPLGLADPEAVRRTLGRAGLDDPRVAPVDAPFFMGADADDAHAFIRNTAAARGLLQGLDEPDRSRALDALHATIRTHETGDGVVFGSGCWLITARQASPGQAAPG